MINKLWLEDHIQYKSVNPQAAAVESLNKYLLILCKIIEEMIKWSEKRDLSVAGRAAASNGLDIQLRSHSMKLLKPNY